MSTPSIVPDDVTSPLAKCICQFLHYRGPSALDSIAAALDIPEREVSSTLSVLEDRGIVRDEYEYYVLTRDLSTADFRGRESGV